MQMTGIDKDIQFCIFILLNWVWVRGRLSAGTFD